MILFVVLAKLWFDERQSLDHFLQLSAPVADIHHSGNLQGKPCGHQEAHQKEGGH